MLISNSMNAQVLFGRIDNFYEEKGMYPIKSRTPRTQITPPSPSTLSSEVNGQTARPITKREVLEVITGLIKENNILQTRTALESLLQRLQATKF